MQTFYALKNMLASRLLLRISCIVFASILLIESLILVPSYNKYEQDLYTRLFEIGKASAPLGFVDNPNQIRSAKETENRRKSLLESNILGQAIYDLNHQIIFQIGTPPVVSKNAFGSLKTYKFVDKKKQFYDLLFPASTSKTGYRYAVRLDTAWIQSELNKFVWRIIGLTFIISVAVSGTTMMIVAKTVLSPIRKIDDYMSSIVNDADHIKRPSLNVSSHDEIGQLAKNLNIVLTQIDKLHISAKETSDNRFKDFADSASDWFWEMDSNLRFSYFSSRFEEISGVPPVNLLGKTREETGIPNVEEDVWFAHLSDLKNQRPFRNFCHPRTMTNGSVVELSINGKPVFDKEGVFQGYRGTGSDISKVKKFEEQLIEAKLTAEQANLTKSEFLANMSHDLRTPLNAILGFSEILKSRKFADLGQEKSRDYANDIHSAGSHLLEIINEILDVAKIEAGQFQISDNNVNMEMLLESCVTMNSVQATKIGVNIILDTPRHSSILKGDETRIKQIFLNLLSNALKFTDKGGDVTLSLKQVDDGFVEISVTDTGIGIKTEDLDLVLSKFGKVQSSYHRNYEGTGLGLTLVQLLVGLHGGTFKLESSVGVGTKAIVLLPMEKMVQAA